MPPRLGRPRSKLSSAQGQSRLHHARLSTIHSSTHIRQVLQYGRRKAIYNSQPQSRYYATGREPTYYEVLNIPVTASAAEIKKQFYALSLTHHPDRNRSDPEASSRFATISDAYHTLSNANKRARYDRDHGINAFGNNSNTHSSANPGQHPMGSHSSYSANLHNKGSYVGSRPASGLSKRRGTFKGPPPSFYAHGGYGATANAMGRGAGASSKRGQTAGSASASASASSEEDPSSFIHNNPVWHFNARSHFKTQSAEDARRTKRKIQQMGLDDRTVGGGGGGFTGGDAGGGYAGSFLIRFMVVCGILFGTASLSGLWSPSLSKKASNKEK